MNDERLSRYYFPCPECGEPVLFASFQNVRSGRWVILPLEDSTPGGGNFVAIPNTHPTVDMLGVPAGDFPISMQKEDGNYVRHKPSHFLGVRPPDENGN